MVTVMRPVIDQKPLDRMLTNFMACKLYLSKVHFKNKKMKLPQGKKYRTYNIMLFVLAKNKRTKPPKCTL